MLGTKPRSAAILALTSLALAVGAQAQQDADGAQGGPEMDAMRQHMRMMMGASGAPTGASGPEEGGQAAFGAIAEVVGILEADPDTDWSRVDIDALRQHLIDMDEVTLRAEVESLHVEAGAEFRVTGQGRTVDSVRRMVHAHATQVGSDSPFTFEVEDIEGGALVRTLAREPADEGTVARVRGLGFIGLMTLGAHHGPHHVAIARGDAAHVHGEASAGHEAPAGHQH